jgi:tRNA modification GTPase
MFSTSDTIVAIATPPGRGALGIVRISGASAAAVASQLITHDGELEPRRATVTTIRVSSEVRLKPDPRTGSGSAVTAVDQVVVTYFRAPHSYTGDDVVEVSAHGSPVVLRAIVERALDAGARLAEPGEFTLRAFLNQRIDLVQAEAVGDLINAATPLQARAAFDQLQGTLTRAIGEIDAALFELVAKLEASVDFPDEGYHFVQTDTLLRDIRDLRARTARLACEGRRGRLIREGLQVAIVGKPNVGKSSLFNALVGCSRAIVSDTPGTTRDLVTETIDLSGLRIVLVDTAGRREARDVVEAEGVARSRGAESVSELILVVIDGSQPLDGADREMIEQVAENKRLIVFNKSDIRRASNDALDEENAIFVSALTGDGLSELRKRIACELDVEPLRDAPQITNVRHVALLDDANEALARAEAAIASRHGAISEEFVLADLRAARGALEEISGKRVTDDLLAHIFSSFCIGK